jgi:anaerobic ribonucleoside-triphosphate reductase
MTFSRLFTVLHVYLGEQVSEVEATKNLIRKIVTRFKLPYFTLTPTFSVCPCHGYLRGEQEKCPTCQEETEVYSRVVGYLRPIKQWNEGKRAEFEMRRPFRLPVVSDYSGPGEYFPILQEEKGPYLKRSAG